MDMDIQIQPEEAKQKLGNGQKVVFLDVREQWEYDLARIEGATLIPLGELQQRANELDPESEIIVYCATTGCGVFTPPCSSDRWALARHRTWPGGSMAGPFGLTHPSRAIRAYEE